MPELKELQALISECQYLYEDCPDKLALALKMSKYAKDWALKIFADGGSADYMKTYWSAMYFEAPHDFESYMLYMEKNRAPEKQFYLPRRATLSVVAHDLQDLEDGKYKFYGLSMPPRVGKSTICLFFLSWIMGKRPNSHNGMSGHSSILADGFYEEILNLIDTPEYTFREIFPKATLYKKSAEKKEIILDKPDRFATLTCRGIEGTWTGAVDISSDGYLYTDDLVRDREESLSPKRLDDRYQSYLNVLVDRKNDKSRELMVGTRWNVLDPLGRVHSDNKDNPRYKFRRIPALNRYGVSNFQYRYNLGFSTEYYLELRDRLDHNEFMAKYQQAPYVREGLYYKPEEMRYFNGVLPDGDARIVAACDVAWGSGDRVSMPIGKEYANGDVYIFDWVFNAGTKEETIPAVAGRIIGNEIRQIQFEGNNGGELYAKNVDDYLQKEKYKCSCTHKRAPNTMDKMAKLAAYSGDIKRKFVFLEEGKRPPEYQAAMDELFTTTQVGKNPHDDAIDGLTQLAIFIEGTTLAEVKVLGRVF